MAYFNDKLLLISDSHENIDVFRLLKGKITRYNFNYETQKQYEKVIAKEVFLEYDGSIDENDTIYIICQDKSFDLILILLKKNKDMEVVKLTEEPIPEVYYLNIILDNDKPHIFYFILTSKIEKKYRIYHHYFTGGEWITNKVDEIKVRELLNPLKIFRADNEIILSYYNKIGDEQIYIKKFDLNKEKWEEKIRLTDDERNKLYLDFVVGKDKIHLTYCQYEEGNLVVKYERYSYDNVLLRKEVEEKISNIENPQDPTLIYYEDRLWIVWIEYENVMSRYSDDFGNTWSPIYLWKESKGKDIVRYKYNKLNNEGIILNYSFGKIDSDISFIGIGVLDNTIEIPLKKKAFQTIIKNIPRF
ncbi:hypothetical protein [Clostridium sp. Cult2]|uniref:hypothetical protein n=1 Tax=Clostridium sp. Cult2 TaxID=2079003 RepID=UPI001F44F5A3|nr:hypothetical protein [Clostridium sp. Cult2]MCF6465708.1 hypothetical protein [Clostridium sp. Cult2]